MSNDCLVTRLKGVVNNSDLPYYGEVCINVFQHSAATAQTNSLRITPASECKIIASGTGYFTDSELSENIGNELTLQAQTETIVYFAPGTYKVSLLARYDGSLKLRYNGATANNVNYSIALNDLNYLNGIWLNSRASYGNLSVFANKTVLGNIDLNDDIYNKKHVQGDITDILPFDFRENYIILNGCSEVTGDIVSFMDKYINAGLTNDINLWVQNGKITYNNSILRTTLSISNISQNTFTVAYSGTTDVWVKNGNTWELQ